MKRVLAEVITIGDELLIGQVVDTNSAWLGQTLNPAGVEIKQITSVSDEKGHIVEAIESARKRADILILTGGLGPTRDDITKKTLADYFGVGLRVDEKALQHVRDLFARLNRPMLDINEQQALIPENCTPIYNDRGTAPGMWFEDKGQIIVSLPGVPYEMKHMITSFVIPRLKDHFDMPVIRHRTLLTSGIGESYLSKKIEAIELGLPEYIKLAYLPNFNTVRLRFSARGADAQILDQELDQIAEAVKREIGMYLAADHDGSLQEILGQEMLRLNATLATAESCTGGYIAHLITSVAGSSAYFLGSQVAYANEVKINSLGVEPKHLENFGAVSEEVVREMAEGVRKNMGATY
ncbi:MAG: CinA family nicotinamide mononucleotide deamidase-related protein, partial [Bacteroidota bacterium]|nr:CinA family nicotinamide mononucleotide deamidase-related protein [Bacteroidota bacterium]MDX5430839.1 CinA family nicotinamide mononucleotide deamidase-related protein [Bacteroidota bacterium]MDX5469583.1 CinA family nicotinamide mononucleotide deamidase-related protein [Bacteroidota bacterium]